MSGFMFLALLGGNIVGCLLWVAKNWFWSNGESWGRENANAEHSVVSSANFIMSEVA